MGLVTEAIHDRLVGDGELETLLASYGGEPAVFTVDPVPGDAELPYVVTVGQVWARPFDSKTTRGRELMRDVRCYSEADGSAALIEAIAERVRTLLHRQPLTIEGFGVWLTECSGPVSVNEPDAYGRIVSVRMSMMEE